MNGTVSLSRSRLPFLPSHHHVSCFKMALTSARFSNVMPALVLLAALVALVSLSSANEGPSSLVRRRVLESEPGYNEIIRHLKEYELHDFSSHEPTRRALSSAGETSMPYELNVLGRRMLFDLERYDDLFAKDYKHYFVDAKGEVVKTEPALDCLYKGKSRENGRTLATIALCDGTVRATVRDDNPDNTFTIQPLEDKPGSEHVVYRHRDLREIERFCGVGRDKSDGYKPKASAPVINVGEGRNLRGDQHDEGHFHAHANEQQARTDRNLAIPTKTVGIVVVNDKKRYDQKGSTVHLSSSALFGVANNLYTNIVEGAPLNPTHNIRLEILSQYTFTQQDPWVNLVDGNGEVSANDQLTKFDTWRGSNAQPSNHDLAHLLTGFTYQSSTIGLAYLRAVCTPSKSGVTQATDLSDAHISSTITHEVGHNLGSEHTDTPPSGFDSCLNTNAGHIMASSSSGANTAWDPCSVKYFNNQWASSGYLGSPCADTPAATVWTSDPVCGDGIVQGDEQCDCINKNCAGVDPCCNEETCQLLETAQCSALGGCCSPTCQIITNTSHVCRAAVSDCDIVETCPGNSGNCPFDTFKDTGLPCVLPSLGVNGTCFFKECMDQKKDCENEGQDRVVAEQWDQTCCDESGLSGTCGGFPASGGCVLTCKKGLAGSCQRLSGPKFYSDGTQCAVGKGCYQGTCVPFEQIPVPNNPNCTNNVIDQNETDLDCGGPNCFGCGPGKLCLADDDCAFPGFCNRTGTLVDANGYTGLGRCTASSKPTNDLEEFLNAVLDWFQKNPFIWGPIVGVLGLLILGCCCCPRGSRPPVAKAGMMKAQQSFRTMRGQAPMGNQQGIPTAVVVKAT